MTEGRPLGLLVRFALPLLAGNIFQQLYSMVDAIVVGKFVSKEALAAIGATGAILNLLISLIIGFTVGIAIVTAQFYGARNGQGLHATFATAAYITVIAYAVLSVAGCLLARPALLLLDTPDKIIEDAQTYLLFNFATCIAPIAYNILSNFIRSLGDSKTPLYALVISSLLNIGLDLLFVLVFRMEVAGVALATAIAQAVSAAYCFFRLRSRFRETLPLRGEWKPSRGVLGSVLKYGVPMALQNAFLSVGMMAVQSVINGFGTDVVAGYTAANKVDQIAMQPMMSIGTAVSTYAGQNYGAKKAERITSGMRAALLMAVAAGAFLSLLIVTCGRFLVLLFLDASETLAIQVSTGYLTTISLFYILCGVMYVYTNGLRGMGRVVVPTAASFLELGAKIAGAYLLSAAFGYAGIWYAWPIAWLASDLLLVIPFHLGGWKKKLEAEARAAAPEPDEAEPLPEQEPLMEQEPLPEPGLTEGA